MDNGEESLKEDGVGYVKGNFPFITNSQARAQGYGGGFVKIPADAKTDRVLGVHILGHEAGPLVSPRVRHRYRAWRVRRGHNQYVSRTLDA